MPTAEEILNLPLDDRAASASGATTIRGYLVNMLAKLWRQGEDFNGKRPFGNSCWDMDLHGPLAKAGFIAGSFDEYGDMDLDIQHGDKLIADAIASLASPSDRSAH